MWCRRTFTDLIHVDVDVDVDVDVLQAKCTSLQLWEGISWPRVKGETSNSSVYQFAVAKSEVFVIMQFSREEIERETLNMHQWLSASEQCAFLNIHDTHTHTGLNAWQEVNFWSFAEIPSGLRGLQLLPQRLPSHKWSNKGRGKERQALLYIDAKCFPSHVLFTECIDRKVIIFFSK